MITSHAFVGETKVNNTGRCTLLLMITGVDYQSRGSGIAAKVTNLQARDKS